MLSTVTDEKKEVAEYLRRHRAWAVRPQDARTKAARTKRRAWLEETDGEWYAVLDRADFLIKRHPELAPAREFMLEMAADSRADLEEFRWSEEEKAQRAVRAAEIDAARVAAQEVADRDPLRPATYVTDSGAKRAAKAMHRALAARARARAAREVVGPAEADAIAAALHRRFGGGNRYNRLVIRVEEDTDELGRTFYTPKASWSQAKFGLSQSLIRRPLLAEGDELGVGAFAIDTLDNTSRRVSFDIDEHREGQDARGAFVRLCAWLVSASVPHVRAVSKGGKGYHVHIFTCPLKGAEAANLGRGIARAAGLPEDVEIFPKSGAETHAYGNSAGAIGVPGALGFAETTGGAVLIDEAGTPIPLRQWPAVLDGAGTLDRAGAETIAARCGHPLDSPLLSLVKRAPRAAVGTDADLEPKGGEPREFFVSTVDQAVEFLTDLGFEIRGEPKERQDGTWTIRTRLCPTADRHNSPGKAGAHAFTFTPKKALPLGSRCLHDCCSGIAFKTLAEHWGIVVGNPDAGYKPQILRKGPPAGNPIVYDSPLMERVFLSRSGRQTLSDLAANISAHDLPSDALAALVRRAAIVHNNALVVAECGYAMRIGEKGPNDLRIDRECQGPCGTTSHMFVACERRNFCPGCATYFAGRVEDFARAAYRDEFCVIWFDTDEATHPKASDAFREIQMRKKRLAKFFSGWRRRHFNWHLGLWRGCIVTDDYGMRVFEDFRKDQFPWARAERYRGTQDIHRGIRAVAEVYTESAKRLGEAANDGRIYDALEILETFRDTGARRHGSTKNLIKASDGSTMLEPLPWFSELDCRALCQGLTIEEGRAQRAEVRKRRLEEKRKEVAAEAAGEKYEKPPRKKPEPIKCGRETVNGPCQCSVSYVVRYQGAIIARSPFLWNAKRSAFQALIERRQDRHVHFLQAVG